MGCAEVEGKVPPLGILELESFAVAQVAAVRAQHLADGQLTSRTTKATNNRTKSTRSRIEVDCLLTLLSGSVPIAEVQAFSFRHSAPVQ